MLIDSLALFMVHPPTMALPVLLHILILRLSVSASQDGFTKTGRREPELTCG